MKKICDGSMSFQECELAILRSAVDKAEERSGRSIANSADVKKIISIVERFIQRKKLICYGGTAINNILPKQDQFYNTDVEIPDYDFFSPHALRDSKELCDDYVKEGFVEVEGKSGQHLGTFKVFVNFIPVADVTFLHKDIFKSLQKESIRIAGIYYASPNYLRMGMYLELSRPAGDVSRWEKVLKRLILLNKHYPLRSEHCKDIDFQRSMENKEDEDQIYEIVRDTLINQGVVFFGGYALSLYSHYMPNHLQKKLGRNPDFDVLSEDPKRTAEIVRERLQDEGFNHIKIVKRDAIGEIVAPHYQVMVGKDTVVFIYEPIACHSYNTTTIDHQQVKIATIDTMLSFYLAFLYSARNYYDTDRIVCMAQFLFQVQQQNRLQQKGLLKRFSINCYGHQQTLEEIRAEKAEKFKEFKQHPQKKNDTEYEEWFLRYRPADQKVVGKKCKKTDKKTDKKMSVGANKKRINTTKKRGRGGLFN